MPVLFEVKDLVIPGIPERLNLQLDQGMTVFLITSGDRESELVFRTLLGEQIPESGTVMFEEQCLHCIDRHERLKIRQVVATVTATTNLISNLKVWENITLPLMYHNGSLAPESTDQALQLLEEAGLLENIWSLPGHLSAADRIMVSFIRAVISAPRFLVVAASLENLPSLQQHIFLRIAANVQSNINAPATLFITTEMIQLPGLQPDMIIDLRQSPALIMRKS